MDFTNAFLKVGDFKFIFMMVDRSSKYVVLILAPHVFPQKDVARLLFSHMVKYFLLPRDIVTDSDAQFVKYL